MKKILIVEDEKNLREALVVKFREEEFEVLEAENGEEGLRVALEKIPDIMLIDLLMPVMDGITMLDKLRENKKVKDIKVLILTNLSDSDKIAESFNDESLEYLIKSDWSLEDVVKKVRGWIH